MAVIMCGGKGSRFITPDNIEKPLARIKGKTLIETVLHAVILSGQLFAYLALVLHRQQSFYKEITEQITILM